MLQYTFLHLHVFNVIFLNSGLNKSVICILFNSDYFNDEIKCDYMSRENIAHMEMRNTNKILAGNPERKQPLGKSSIDRWKIFESIFGKQGGRT